MSKVVVMSKPETLKHDIQAGTHKLLSDAPKDAGGSESAPNPHELLLSALGACTSMTMQIFAKRRNWEIGPVKVELSEELVDDPQNPGKRMFRIKRLIEVKGNLTQEQLDGLKTAADKCPIHKLLTGSKEVLTELAHE